MSIIKRKKRDQFFIMSNHATQQNLTSLNAIGLLAYIKSLPEDWTLYKTLLQADYEEFIDETLEEIKEEVTVTPTDPEAYFNSVVDMIITRRKKKLGIVETPSVPFYNWLEA